MILFPNNSAFVCLMANTCILDRLCLHAQWLAPACLMTYFWSYPLRSLYLLRTSFLLRFLCLLHSLYLLYFFVCDTLYHFLCSVLWLVMFFVFAATLLNVRFYKIVIYYTTRRLLHQSGPSTKWMFVSVAFFIFATLFMSAIMQCYGLYCDQGSYFTWAVALIRQLLS